MSKSTGGPAFRRNVRPSEGLWLVVAIASFGPSACGTSDSGHDGDSGTASSASGSGGALYDGATSDDGESGAPRNGSGSASSGASNSNASSSSASSSGSSSGIASASTSSSSSSGSGSSSSSSSSASSGSASASSSGGSASSSGGGGGAGGAKFDYLVVILMENHSIGDIYGPATYMTTLANQNALMQNYSAIAHPSEPNYLAIASAQTFLPTSADDGYHVFMAKNVVDALESVGKTWRAYTESATSLCDTSNPDVRHVPFLFFADVVTSRARCARVVPTTAGTDREMIADLSSASPPNFIWLTPNDNNNMHSGTVARGDAYLGAIVPAILSSATFKTRRAALFVVFDEGSGPANLPKDLVYAVWAGPTVRKALKSTTTYSHYSILATLRANWGFPALGANDAAAASMLTEVFP